jgi:sortase A
VKKHSAEFILVVAGACLLMKGGWNLGSYAAFQTHPDWFVKRASHVSSQGLDAAALPISFHSSSTLRNITDLRILGKLEVARLGMSVLVVEGDDEQKLGLAAGHLYGTAALGAKGNAVVAGHRDTSFWPLRNIRIGDRVRIRASKSTDYVVSSIRIVSPNDVSVLRGGTEKRILTLVTCYPFRYFGSAPKRLVVQATAPTT